METAYLIYIKNNLYLLKSKFNFVNYLDRLQADYEKLNRL